MLQRIVDSITPEALFLSLYYGSGVLLIRSDEFKGFYDKCIVGAQNVSAFCSAFTGEPFSYATVKRGEDFTVNYKSLSVCTGALNIDKNRLTIVAAIQPGPLVKVNA